MRRLYRPRPSKNAAAEFGLVFIFTTQGELWSRSPRGKRPTMPTDPGYEVAPGGPESRQGGISRTALAMGLAAFASFFLAAISLYFTLALKAEVTVLRSHLSWEKNSHQQQAGNAEMLRDGQWHSPSPHEARPTMETPKAKERGTRIVLEKPVFQPCLQMIANSHGSIIQKDSTYTAIPWLVGLRRGDTLLEDKNTILVIEGGLYLVYGQVYYMDKTFAMGHVINRIKQEMVGNNPQKIPLFRCIQNMNQDHPYNTCYTAGVVKLEAGDRVELLIPRQTANISLSGEDTFFGIIGLL
uniref:TNF superfamily member 13b n=1 Tax=Paramormyrops kingsleyae TaxID=1676925 RepID=A0A3B3SF37_9TELE|nr:tumor necrosis factor ligand superfamily member 13B isoform X1 [Paramormyrops kingsleyae]